MRAEPVPGRGAALARAPAHAERGSPVTGRLAPARPQHRPIPRDALVQRLVDARRQRCVVIRGCAGSGKTTLLALWRRALLTLDFDVAWLSLTAADNAPDRLIDALTASVHAADPMALGDAGAAGDASGDAVHLERAVIALVQSLGQRSREMVLMLDDLQHLHDSRTLQVVQWLLEYAPRTLHVAFASSAAIPQPLSVTLARWLDQQLVTGFDMRDLRFSAAETGQLLSLFDGSGVRDAAQLHNVTRGWARPLELIASGSRGGQAVPGTAASAITIPLLRDFLERAVGQWLRPDDLDLLRRSALCQRFCAPLCACIAGDMQAEARILAQLSRVADNDFLLVPTPAGDGQVWYEMHPLVRALLLTRVAVEPAAELQVLHRRAWQWFEATGHLDEAVHHAVRAGEFEAAVSDVERSARDLLARGEFERVLALAEQLPRDRLQTRVKLRLAVAHAQLAARELETLEPEIEALGTLPLDEREHAELSLLRVGFALHRDDVDAAIRLLPELEQWTADADEFVQSTRTSLLGWAHIARGDFAMARRILGDTGAWEGGLRANLTARCLAGLSLSMEGRMTDAERLYRDVLQVADQHGSAFVAVSTMASALLGDVLYELDEVDAACQLLEDRIDLIERSAFPEAMLRAAVVLASSHWVSGRRAAALAWLERLERYAQRQRLERLLAHALCLRFRLLQQQGEAAPASTALARLDALAAGHASSQGTCAFEIGSLAGRAHVAVSLHRGDLEQASRLLRQHLADAERAGRFRPVVAMRLQLALVEQSCGREQAGAQLLVDALGLGHRLGLLRTVLDASRRVPQAIDALQQERLLDPVLSFYVRRLLEARVHGLAAPPAPAGAGVIEPLKDREREILGLLAQALPNKKIAKVLGLSPETVKWHLKNIYPKLGVLGRDEAVARARDLGL